MQARARAHNTNACPWLAFGLALTCVVALGYIGPRSAAAVVLCPLIYAYGLTNRRMVGWLVYGTCSLGVLTMWLVTLAGSQMFLQVPLGLRADFTDPNCGLMAVVEAILFVTFMLARKSQRSAAAALERVAAAHRQLELRDEQLELRDEQLDRARADLDRFVGAVAIGRLTGKRVGAYSVGELIGRGGMGEVYRAWSDELDAPVALKVIHEAINMQPAMIDRFFREAQVAGSLHSPHIVKVLDSGWDREGHPYLAMELLQGRDLSSHLRALGQLTPDETAELVTQVAAALATAHRAGIVHRDMKPDNVFLAHGRNGYKWKVLDFGISKVLGGSGTLTQGGLIGTPNYMAPEQVRSTSGVDGRADVFSLGAIAYRALTGSPAFDASDPVAALVQVMKEQPAAPRELVDLHSDIELVLALALAKDPDARFATVIDFAQAFSYAVSGNLSQAARDSARALLEQHPWRGCDELCTLRPDNLLAPSLRDPAPLALRTVPPPISPPAISPSPFPSPFPPPSPRTALDSDTLTMPLRLAEAKPSQVNALATTLQSPHDWDEWSLEDTSSGRRPIDKSMFERTLASAS